jgi:hypothetical protein
MQGVAEATAIDEFLADKHVLAVFKHAEGEELCKSMNRSRSANNPINSGYGYLVSPAPCHVP